MPLKYTRLHIYSQCWVNPNVFCGQSKYMQIPFHKTKSFHLYHDHCKGIHWNYGKISLVCGGLDTWSALEHLQWFTGKWPARQFWMKQDTKVGVGTPICGRILGFQETLETKISKKEDCCQSGDCIYCPDIPCYWLAGRTNWPRCELYVIPQYLKFGMWSSWLGEANTFNTTFGCENMVCRPFSSEPQEMLLGCIVS
jgi:hypothetical protein